MIEFNKLLAIIIKPPTQHRDLTSLVLHIIDYVYTLLLYLCTIMVLVAAFQMLTSAGDPEKIKKSKRILFWTLVVLGIAFLSKGIPYLIKELLEAKNP